MEHERSPLQKQTARLVRNLALLALALSLALVVVHGLIKGDWLQALLAGIALAMAMLPEEYPVVLTVFPALGARRLSKEGVLTRKREKPRPSGRGGRAQARAASRWLGG